MSNFPHITWRLLRTPAAPGSWNMALDEAILESTGSGDVSPTLRLYAWHPPCLSLGYAQPIRDVNMEGLSIQGWDLVRRPTGGRAILHSDELTYSVSGPQDDPRLAGSVLESYAIISSALLRALHILNIPAKALEKVRVATSGQPGEQNPVCFEVPSNYEITVEGKKLIGSAQARRKHGVLQHGSLPLCGDLSRITQALAFPDEEARMQAAQRLLDRATTVESILRTQVSWETAAQAFVTAFQETLDLTLEQAEPTPAELARTELLLQEKYANPGWTHRLTSH